jgi:hypothetical protein
MTVTLDELIRYWHRELDDARSAEIEDAVFDDAAVARKLQAIAALDDGVRAMITAGRLQSTLTVRAVDALAAAGLAIRTYELRPGEVVPCTIAGEDLVAIRLRGTFAADSRVDVIMDGSFEGMQPASEHYEDVAVDRETSEVVLVYPGERIRALPRSRFRYTVTSNGAPVGEYHLDHTPPASR